VGEAVKTFSRNQPLKAARYTEPCPVDVSTRSAVPTQSAHVTTADVTADIIVHKAHHVDSKPPGRAAAAEPASQQAGSQQRTPTTTITDHTQRKDSNIVVLKKLKDHPKRESITSSSEKTVATADVDIKRSLETSLNATQPTILPTSLPREPPDKPAQAKPKQETEKPHESKGQESTPGPRVKMKERVVKPAPVLFGETSSTRLQLEQVEPTRVPTHSTPHDRSLLGDVVRSPSPQWKSEIAHFTPVSMGKVRRDMFQVRVKSEPAVKSSPVKVQSKPRRQTRATLAYDRVMFFSDFFRRLESDRRLFALPPVRRNRVYVSPRAEDTFAAPVKFSRPPATKKGRIGIVSAVARNSSARSSPFASKRRIPSHALEHKIDLESIEADATLTAQPSQSQWNSVDHQQALSSALTQPEQPMHPSEKSVRPGESIAEADSTKFLRAANAAESAFTCATKHSSKMKRKLKRKQRKRSVTTADGKEGGVQDSSTSGSEERTPSHRADDQSKRVSKNEHHRLTDSITVANIIPPKPSQKSSEATDTRLQSHASCPVLKIEPIPVKSPKSDDRQMCVSAPRGKTIVEILSHIGEQNPTSTQPDVATGEREQICPVSVVVQDTERSVNSSDSKLQATVYKSIK